MAKASDCGSEDRGFESHYPPHKNDTIRMDGVIFMDTGTRKAGTSAHTGAKTVQWTVFRPWESLPPGKAQSCGL